MQVPKKFVMSDTAKERERYCNHGDPNCLGSFFPAKYAPPTPHITKHGLLCVGKNSNRFCGVGL